MNPAVSSHHPEEVEERLRAAFPHAPTASQEALLHALGRFLVSPQPRCCLVVRGYAGTGKTTTMAALVQVLRDLRRPVELLAPTGRAAQVMGRYAGLQASTIHRRIYLRKATPDGGTS
ncbi:MAG: AAA family ATPase, partial [Flavobacteriales bacterium]